MSDDNPILVEKADQLYAIYKELAQLPGTDQEKIFELISNKPDIVEIGKKLEWHNYAFGPGVRHCIFPAEVNYMGDDTVDTGDALALLLASEEVMANSHHWRKDWPEEARQYISIHAVCNDVFAGGGDAETVPILEISNLFRMWRKDPNSGVAWWCILQRRERPSSRMEAHLRKQGIWPIDEKIADGTLRPNYGDAYMRILREVRYELLTQHARDTGILEIPPIETYQVEWKEFLRQNPGWEQKLGVDAVAKTRIEQWKQENGYTQ